ncbi:MAG: TOBE domain-containing protein, partial [Bacilli bacterium]|nr:TOBE domain-containing protein [Bacilli bacterium]
VAGFIGAPQMNFFNEAKLIKVNGKHYVEIKDSLFPVGTNSSKLLDINQVNEGEVVVGVRPEHMSFSIIPNKNALKCKLVVSEMMGSELHLHLALEDGSQIVCRVQTVNLTEEERRAATVPGSECYITFEGKVIHLFDKNTSTSLLHPEYEYKY